MNNLKQALSAQMQSIVKKFSSLTECKRDDSCRCDGCKNTLASYPSRKKAREGSSFTKFAFPLVRRAFPPALAPSLVSIQPMTQPHSSVFYINYIKDTQDGSGEDEGK